MLDTLRDLLRYEAWADSAILACVAEHGVWDDSDLRERLHHAHVVQRVHRGILRGEPVDLNELERPFGSIEDLGASIEQYRGDMASFVDGLTGDDLDRVVTVPWFGDKEFSARQILLQIVMHSQHHRGQSAMRLKQLGHVPPTFDYIVWIARGQPDVNS